MKNKRKNIEEKFKIDKRSRFYTNSYYVNDI